MDINIRPLEEQDYSQWKNLWQQYIDFYKSKLSDEIIDIHWNRLLSTNLNEYSGFVAVSSNELVGLAHYLFHRHGWYIENVCYLQDLYVVDNYRNQGIGKKLIKAVSNLAKANNAKKLYWLTDGNNTEACMLYNKLAIDTGFIQYEMAL